MKKVLLGIVFGAAVIVGLLFIWKFALPFIGNVFSGLGNIISGFLH